MKIMITGSDGFTGSRYCRKACEEGHEVLGADVKNEYKPKGCRIERLDIRDRSACKALCDAFRPDALIHAARAPGSLWQIEKDRSTAYQINVLGTRHLARCAADHGAAFVFLSTDWVFGGRKAVGGKYREEEDGCPLNYYGVTKWIAEREMFDLQTRWLILRPAHVYGFHAAVLDRRSGNKTDLFEGSVWAGIGRSIQRGDKVRAPGDMHQTPVYVNHLVETTLKLLEGGFSGVYHVADRDGLSRCFIARGVLGAVGLEADWIEEGAAEDFGRMQGIPPDLYGILPGNTCLDVGKVETALGMRMLSFEEGLARMKSELIGKEKG